MSSSAAKRVLITGAAGQIGYSLAFNIAQGLMLGPDQKVILHLFDVPVCEDGLKGVVLELEDCAFPLVEAIVPSVVPEVAFNQVDYAVMVGAMPRKPGMERADLLKANAKIFQEQGEFFARYSNPEVRVLVVGNPANTNALLAIESSKSKLRPDQFTALTRLDHNRAIGQLALRLHVQPPQVKNVIIWGNHSATQYPDASHGVVVRDGVSTPLHEAVNDQAYLEGAFISTIQQRGAAVLAARKLSSAASAAKAIVDHMRNWVLGTPEGEWVSMAIFTEPGNPYGVPAGLVYSHPVTCKNGTYEIVKGLSVSAFSQAKMDITTNELIAERDTAFSFLTSAAL